MSESKDCSNESVNGGMNQSYSKALRILYKSSGSLDSFSLFRKLMLPVSGYSAVVEGLARQSYIVVEEDRIRTLPKGTNYVETSVFDEATKFKSWREIPAKLLGRRIDLTDFYIPSLKILDEKTFRVAKGK